MKAYHALPLLAALVLAPIVFYFFVELNTEAQTWSCTVPLRPAAVPRYPQSTTVVEYKDTTDAIFLSLRLWQDTNHNGVSETSELKRLSQLTVPALDLKYKESKQIDQYGNEFRYRAKVKDEHGAPVGRWVWDSFLVAQP